MLKNEIIAGGILYKIIKLIGKGQACYSYKSKWKIF